MSVELEPLTLSHAAPTEPLSVADARRTMQLHLVCTIDSCDRKKAAYQALVEAGVIVPDSGRLGWGS